MIVVGLGALGLACGSNTTTPPADVVVPPPSPPAASTPAPTASAAPTTAPSAGAPFIRERPDDRGGIDACVYLGGMGTACLTALLEEKDPIIRRYMRRMSDADARLELDRRSRGEENGVPHAEVALFCADTGPCGQKNASGEVLDDGYACLTKAEATQLNRDRRGASVAHARACKCGPERAQIPIMGGVFACDGPNKPVVRAKDLPLDEAKDIRACGECDPEKGPAACARESERLGKQDAELAKYIASAHVLRCKKK
jgi:hypothetical protein